MVMMMMMMMMTKEMKVEIIDAFIKENYIIKDVPTAKSLKMCMYSLWDHMQDILA